MKNQYIFLIFMFCLSCNDQLLQIDQVEEVSEKQKQVKLPLILDESEPNQVYSASEITYTKNLFVGVGNLDDESFSTKSSTVNYSNYFFDDDYSPRNDQNIQIIIDTTQVMSIEEYQLPDDFYDSFLLEDFSEENYQKRLDQYPLYRYKSLPVFIINTSSSYNSITIEDGRFAMIYEALDSSNKWTPIEFKTYSWCGNSYSSFDLQKNQFALFKVPEQSGNFKTKLRLKARIGERVFYSNEISGTVNVKQFEFNKSSEPYDWHYVLNSNSTKSLFLDE